MGGLWWLGNDNGLNTCYEGVTTNTSKQTMAFSDFPFPPSLSHFPNPAEVSPTQHGSFTGIDREAQSSEQKSRNQCERKR